MLIRLTGLSKESMIHQILLLKMLFEYAENICPWPTWSVLKDSCFLLLSQDGNKNSQKFM